MSFSNRVELPLRTCWTVGGEQRETLFWPCRSGTARAVVLMIPGSPGLADFYVDFCTIIHDRFAGHMDIICVSHLGHTQFPDSCGTVHRSSKTYSLADQLANMLTVFDEIDGEYAKLDKRPQMLLCGHSIGCYFAQMLVEQRADRVDRVFGLFPAIESIAKSPRGRQLRRLFQPWMRQIAAVAADVLRWLLPLRAVCAIAATADSLDARSARLVVDKFLHGPCIRSVLRMAADELQTIAGLDEDLYAMVGHKFVLYYGRGDGWVPIECYHRMRKINTRGKVFLCDNGISHAFVAQQSAEMAAVVIPLLEEVLVWSD
ncbi:hypothetical protein LPJ61_001582 [Coemansia biformis]|uniref:Lipid droplet-associated hydrolase n=1 Tax=Coemansia biformis TaxID=1286918 RepID=A0A9W7Y9R8_9FUNG|nr:hypothetical protein LPJ61_001582 [Coemansia biformis]